MERTRIAGIKLNDKKCVIKTKECNFFDMLYTPDGVKPSPNKVRVVENLEPPKNKQELHTFFGDGNHERESEVIDMYHNDPDVQ